MILFLTLCYVALILLLVKIKVLPASLPVKLSPIVFMLAMFVFLFIPLQWGAPAGAVQVVRHSVQIVPNVSGQVLEVPVEPNVALKKGDVLFKIDPAQYQAKVDQLTAQLDFAKLRLGQYTQLEKKDVGPRFQVEEAQANVQSLAAQLANAQWELDNTVITAPSDGFVTNLALRPGARVAALPLAPVMAFIDTTDVVVVMHVQQIYLRNIAPGQRAEVTFKAVPGEVYGATVEYVIPATSLGQVAVSGTAVSATNVGAAPFAVRLKLDDPSVAEHLPAGAFGSAAIYTPAVQMGHVIRQVMVRMDAWLNYVVPM